MLRSAREHRHRGAGAWWAAHTCAHLASRRTLRGAALALLLGALALPATRAEAGKDVYAPCLSQKRKARLQQLTRMSRDQEAFRPSGIWLPPLFVSDSTRRFRWIGGVYADYSDPEDDTYTRLALPLLLHDCRPGSRLLVTPLFGSRRDEAGIAGVVGPYFYRRDALASSDVLFPLVWSLRERARPEGPVTWRNSAVVPFYFDWQRDDARTVLVPPLLYGRKSDAAGVAGVVGPYFYRRDALASSDVLFPLIWSHRERDLPGGPYVRRRLVLGPYYQQTDPGGWSAGLLPFWIGGREGERRWDVVPPLLLHREAWPGHLRVRVALAKYERDPDEWRFSLPPLIWAGGDGSESYALGLPVFADWHKRDRFRFTLVGPFFRYHRPLRGGDAEQEDHRRWAAGIVPLWIGGRKRARRWDLVPPLLMWWDRGGRETTFTALGSWYHRDDRGFTLGLTPLVYVARRPERQHTLVLPFFGHLQGPDRETTFVGPFYSHHRDGHFSAGAFPLWMAWGGEGRRVDVLPPLLTLRLSEDGGERVRFWSVQSWYFKDGEDFRAGSFPFFFAKREGRQHSLFIPPLATYHGGDGEEETTVVLGSWYKKRPNGFSLGLTPLLFAGREGSRRHFVLFPLAWDFDDGWTRTTLVLNTFYQRRIDGWRAGFVPLYFGGKTGHRRWDLVPPLFIHLAQGEGPERKDSVLFGPLYRHRMAQGWHAGLAPLYFGGRHATGGYDVVPPLLLARWRDEQGTRLWFANTWYRHRPDGTFSFSSFPLAFAGRTEHRHWLSIPPLLFHHSGREGVERTLAGPLYLSRVGEKRTRALFPLFFSRRTPEMQLDLALPGFYRYRDAEGWEAGLLPLWAGGRNSRRSFHIIPPLFAYWQKTEDELRLGLLNTRYVKRPDGHALTVFPLLFEGRRGDRHHLVVPPLLFDFASPERRLTVVGPFYRARSESGWRAGVFPLYLGARTDERSTDLIPPLLTWRNVHAGRTSLVVGPFYRVKDEAGWSGGLFPLYFGSRNERFDYDLVPPALFYRRVQGEDATLVAGPYFRLKRGESVSGGLLPLFLHGREGERRWTLVPPLLAYHSREPGRSTFWMLNTWHRRRGERVSWGSFPLVFARRSPEASSLTLPPLLMHFGRTPEGSTTWVGPFLHHRRGERSTTVVGPAFLHRRGGRWSAGLAPVLFAGGGEGHAHAYLPPIFFYRQRPDRSRLTLLPLLHYRRDADEATLYTPLAYYRSHPEGHAFYSPVAVSYRNGDRFLHSVVGLYWRGAGPDLAATVVAPFYWDLRFPGSGTRFRALAPIYWSFQGEQEETHILLNIAWSSGVGPKGPSYSFRIVPLFSYQRYHPDHLKWQVLEGLAGYEREGERRRYRAFYVWTRPTGGEVASEPRPPSGSEPPPPVEAAPAG
ncbi:MAG: hypothetical protein P1V51_08680 [Deltaproteobacteria bacterium]|nr:hypothetical protein [Deltaproteobacteria bacterium]